MKKQKGLSPRILTNLLEPKDRIPSTIIRVIRGPVVS